MHLHLFKLDLDKVLAAEKAEVELKLYEFHNVAHHAEAMLGYYETRLAALTLQIDQRKKGPELPPPKKP